MRSFIGDTGKPYA